MTGPPHYLPRLSAHELFSILLHREWLRLGFRLRFGAFYILSLSASVVHSGGSHRRLFRLRILLLLLERITGTLLAACMATIRAHLVRAKCRLTTMTMAMDSHPDRLLNPFGRPRDWRLPFVGFELETVLFKQSSSLFLLVDASLSNALLELANGCSLRFGILGLLDRITWTALTAGMTAIGTGLFTAESRLATVTGAVYPHFDSLLDPVTRRYTRILPVARLELHPILLEQGTSLLLLCGMPGSSHGPIRRVHISDGLLNCGAYGRLCCAWSTFRLHILRIHGDGRTCLCGCAWKGFGTACVSLDIRQ